MNTAYDVIPLSPLRKAIASRMVEAKREIPHFRISADVEMDKLLSLREDFNQSNSDKKLSINDFVVKACAMTLMENPQINTQLVDNEIYQFHQADISIVTAVKDGLLTPIIKAANKKSVTEIGTELKELVSRAKNNALHMNEILGGSFTISNLGMYGIDRFDAIINPPQCAILAVGGIHKKPVIKGENCISASVMNCTLSIDHRAIDGSVGAAFLNTLKECLLDPQILLD